jgi:cephalosporin-C deacetylase
MALSFTDLSLPELLEYRPVLAEPHDFDEFWRSTIAEARDAAAAIEVTLASTRLTSVTVEDAVFSGFAGNPVHAWIIRPKDAAPAAPAVVEFIGYGGGRGIPGEKLAWAASGYVYVIMDTRGQGGVWGGGGATPDPQGTGPSTPGFMTRGILDPHDYYYRRVYTDAVRLIDEVALLPGVDPTRIAVAGGSQGGGISLAAAALSDRVAAVLPDVPFLCDFPRSIRRTPEAPFTEITRFLSVHREHVEAVLNTLSYMDGAILARRITAPSYVSVGLMDEIVLPSTVFAAFNEIASEDKSLEVYEFNGHEGGGFFHWTRQADWLAARFGV